MENFSFYVPDNAFGITLLDLVGPQGPQGGGSAGTQGSQGPQGTQGPQGNGIQGPQGVQGARGAQGAQGGAGSNGTQGPQGPPGGGQSWTSVWVEDFLNAGATSQTLSIGGVSDPPVFLDSSLTSGTKDILTTGCYLANGATVLAAAAKSRNGWSSKGILGLSQSIGATTTAPSSGLYYGSTTFLTRGAGIYGTSQNNSFFSPSALGASGVFQVSCGVGFGGTGAGALLPVEGAFGTPSGPGQLRNSAFGLCLFSQEFDGPNSYPAYDVGLTGSFYIDSTSTSSLQLWVYTDNNGDSFVCFTATITSSITQIIQPIFTPPSLDDNVIFAWNYLSIRMQNSGAILTFNNLVTGDSFQYTFTSGGGFYVPQETYCGGTFGIFMSNPAPASTRRINYALDFLNAASIEDVRAPYFY